MSTENENAGRKRKSHEKYVHTDGHSFYQNSEKGTTVYMECAE